MRTRHPYAGLTAVMATKHHKVPLVAPALLSGVGMTVRQAQVDTDVLGTFSGEVERPGSPWVTASAKARLGLDTAGGRLGLASEGSIGPHPEVPWVVVATELVVLVDAEMDIVVAGHDVGWDLRTVNAEVAPGEPLEQVLIDGDAPRHAFIVRPAGAPPTVVGKGLRTTAELERWIARAARASPKGRAIVETDLRAHQCPSRRPAIERAAHRLAQRLASYCPACDAPGWGVTDSIPGALCSACSTPTHRPLAHVWTCVRCDTTEHRTTGSPAEPAQCPWCNP